MVRKLHTVAVDDDEMFLSSLQQLSKKSPFVDIAHTFTRPAEFLAQAHLLNFDLCLLDINMPGLEGTTVAQVLGKKPVIFISGTDHKFRDALNISPIDIVPKPVMQDRLFKAFEKAHDLLATKKEFELFNVAESKRKVKIRLADILLVSTDEVDPRNKQVWLKGGEQYTIMNCKIEHLTNNSPTLIQVSKSHAVSLEAVHEAEFDLLTLKDIKTEDGRPKQVTLGAAYRTKFKERMFYKW